MRPCQGRGAGGLSCRWVSLLCEDAARQGAPADGLQERQGLSEVVDLLRAQELILRQPQGTEWPGIAYCGMPRFRASQLIGVALEASETWTLSRDLFHQLLDRDPRLRDSLLAGLARELRRLTGQVEELHFLDLAGRLAMRLARLARDADPEANEVKLDWPYTQTDLAAMIGGTRQSVNKLL